MCHYYACSKTFRAALERGPASRPDVRLNASVLLDRGPLYPVRLSKQSRFIEKSRFACFLDIIATFSESRMNIWDSRLCELVNILDQGCEFRTMLPTILGPHTVEEEETLVPGVAESPA